MPKWFRLIFSVEVTAIWWFCLWSEQTLCHRSENGTPPTRQRGQGTQEPFVLYNKKTHLVVEFWFFLGPIFSLLVVNGHHHQVISDHVESSSTYIVCLKLASAVKLSLAAQKTSFLSPMHSSTPVKQKLNLWNPDYGRFPKFNLRQNIANQHQSHPKQEGF